MNRPQGYRDRRHAGQVLAREVAPFARSQTRIFGLPRGGMPVALEVARALRASLDVFIVRKLGVPQQPELAMGAIASGDVKVLNDEVIALCKISDRDIDEVSAAESAELHRREIRYRRGRPPVAIAGMDVVLVDDGLATGASMRAAITAVRRQHAAHVMAAVPVGARETCHLIRGEVDAFVCPSCPDEFYAVGAWYEDFSPTSDEEVRACLDEAAQWTGEAVLDGHDLLAEQ
jgi:putative phosphoribosyl transferase